MKIIPIVFSFDDNLVMPAGICITSLLENANKDTFYDIFILHDNQSKYPAENPFNKLKLKYNNFNITYRNVGQPFKGAFEIRGVTIATYYRLLIPELIPEYDKIMYHDVDVIFRNDLSDIFLNTDIENYYVAGVLSSGILDPEVRLKREKLGFDCTEYILAGNLIFNSKLILQDDLVNEFKNEVKNNYEYQDMDIINLICKGKKKILPVEFCGTVEIFKCFALQIDQFVYSQQELEKLNQDGIIHYNGAKPWIKYCPNFDIWWEYYRNSVFYDTEFYFKFYHDKLNDLDTLSLKKRIKLLLRYFKTGLVNK